MLTRDRIVRAAIDLIERDGVEGLSMRKVAAELDAAAMSLYHHVPNKAALLDAVVERIVTDIDFADDPAAPVRERARGMMRAFRKISHDHPRTVHLVITRTFESPATLRLFEHALEIALAAGYEALEATRIAGTFLSFAVGCLMRETRYLSMVSEHGVNAVIDKFASVDPAQFPNITALVEAGFLIDLDAEFEYGLDLLLASALPEG
ncbi:TetR/AcrR family transcriptional regulator C-terminal domain-containing protein [Actinocorallia lasiicapitis]